MLGANNVQNRFHIIQLSILSVFKVNKSKLTNVSGTVLMGVRLHREAPVSVGVVEVRGSDSSQKIKAFFMSSECIETHEKHQICIPGTPVTISAHPVSGDFFPITHVVNSISSIHQDLPCCQDPARVMSKALKILNRIKQNSSLKDFSKSSHDIITYNFLKNEDFVVDSLPSGRLVCMINASSGILEDHQRGLAYFEVSDTNLPSVLNLKDIILIMSRCRDVAIRSELVTGSISTDIFLG